ncbi:RNA-directed DNA polymerase, eukaryota, reverse transcriptase zinc-binding domain protein, partial [Tanacetum coccineum]
MKSLHLSFQKVVNEGLFKGVSLSSSLQLSHLFYADDAIFMGQWSDSNIATIIHVLTCFHKASGLRMNLHKSKLMGVAVEDEKVIRTALKMRCTTFKMPFSYLGIKFGGMMSRINSWDEIVASLHSRLSKWKMKALSIRGRLTLLKSVLGSSPICYMSMFKAPSQVLKRLKAIRCHFFNGADVKENKMSWVKWNRVLASKDKGGFIKALHGEDGRLGKVSKFSYHSVWGNIVNELHMLKNQDMDLLSLMKKKVGNGASLRRSPRDGTELEQFSELKANIDGVQLPLMKDRWCWSLTGSGDFFVASVRKYIDDHLVIGSTSKTRWVKADPIKINVLAWKVRFDFLPTCLNLSRRGLDLQSILCVNCNKEVESTRHVFFDCSMVRDLYRKIASCWDISYSEFSSYEEWLEWLLNLSIQSDRRKILEGVFYVMWWFVLSFGNKCIFGSSIPSKAVIFDDLVSRSFYWCRYSIAYNSDDFPAPMPTIHEFPSFVNFCIYAIESQK